MERGGDESRRSWQEYYRQHAERPPREELLGALDKLAEAHRPLEQMAALDIGAGTMVEAEAMLAAGVGHVIATDRSELAEEAAVDLERTYNDFAADTERFSFHRLANEELAARLRPDSLDLVTAYFSLPFTNPQAFPDLWQALKESLKPGGVLSVSLIGDRDDWARKLADGSPKYPGMSSQTRDEVEGLLTDLQDVQIIESETDGVSSDGLAKHWHVYQIQARKPGQ